MRINESRLRRIIREEARRVPLAGGPGDISESYATLRLIIREGVDPQRLDGQLRRLEQRVESGALDRDNLVQAFNSLLSGEDAETIGGTYADFDREQIEYLRDEIAALPERLPELHDNMRRVDIKNMMTAYDDAMYDESESGRPNERLRVLILNALKGLGITQEIISYVGVDALPRS